MTRTPSGSLPWMAALVVAALLAGAAGVPGALAEPTASPAADPLELASAAPVIEPASPTAVAYEEMPGEMLGVAVALAEQSARAGAEAQEIAEYDPWMPFNEATFGFNRQLDRFVIKPAATAWDWILPDPIQQSLSRAFDNLAMPRRFLNKLFQLRLKAAGLELTRFLVNTTLGFAGFFDVAKEIGIEKKDADTGQTFGVYGSGPGPYLVLPFLPPLTVRDGVGSVFDIAMAPLNYVLPFAALAGMGGGNIINERSLNLELYETVELTVVDLYSAVRNAYLQRRHRLIQDGIQDQIFR